MVLKKPPLVGGGSERFIIECTLDDENPNILTHNVTIQEAYDAFESGKEIWLKINDADDDDFARIHFQAVEKHDGFIGFLGVTINQNGYNIFIFSKDNEVTIAQYTVNGSSAPEPIIFNATMDLHSGDVANTSCNYTYDQIKEMSQNPTMPLTATIIIKNNDSIFGTVSGYSIEAYTGANSITFSRLSYKQNNLLNDTITYHSDGSINLSTSTIMTKETE